MKTIENNYRFYQATKSLCDKCKKQIDAKIIIEDGKVFVLKTCPEHGVQKHILEQDANYHLKKVLYDKPSTKHTNETVLKNGCPFDCGLCPNHEQHTCIGLIEITEKCNLGCPMCYANSSENGREIPLEQIEKMLDYFVEAEGGKAEILQISGGEPTLHSQITELLKLCKTKNIGYVMLNTNGLRIAADEAFVQELSELICGFEVYLQFDSLDDAVYQSLRGKSLLVQKMQAIANLNKYQIPVTLVCTVCEGSNDEELAKLIAFGMETPCVRGINFQPVARFGGYETAEQDSLTVSGILQKIENTSNGLVKFNDFVPLPCNVERVAVSYFYRHKGGFLPITRNKNIEKYVPYISNTFLFTVENMLANGEAPKFGFCNCLDFLNDFNKVVPKDFLLKPKEERVRYLNENTFRITVSSFVDQYNFDLKSMQKECVHVITEDLNRIPFSAYNMFRKDKKSL